MNVNTPDQFYTLAKHLRAMKSPSQKTTAILNDAAFALEQAANPLFLVGELMRTLVETLRGLLDDLKADRQSLLDVKAERDQLKDQLKAAQDSALIDAATIGDLQKKLLDAQKATTVDPANVVAADDPARVEANTILDAEAPAPAPAPAVAPAAAPAPSPAPAPVVDAPAPTAAPAV